ATLNNGGFVVVWQSYDAVNLNFDVYGQIFDNTATKVGGEFLVNSYTEDKQDNPSVSGLANGGFVATWASQMPSFDDFDVFGQVFDQTGTKVGSEFGANSYTPGVQQSSSVAGLIEGGFVVTWDSIGPDGDAAGVFGQQFDDSGSHIGTEFLI